MKLNKAQISFRDSFLALAQTMPYETITVSHIVKNSEYSRRAFYSYYQDKQDFITKLLDHEVQTYVAVICSPISEQKKINLNKDIYLPALDFFNHVYENKQLYHLIINNLIPDYPCELFCKNANQHFRKNLSLDMDSYFSDELNFDFYTYIGTYTFMLYVKFWENNDYSYSPYYMARQVTLMIQMKKIDSITSQEDR